MITPKPNPALNRLLATIVEHLDIPKSYYAKAAARHTSLTDWLERTGSTVAVYKPEVSLQGSFRYGTVNRPLTESEEYDLDNVCTMNIPKTAMSQKKLKHLYGKEIQAYAEAHGMKEPEEHNRCWRLDYSDEVLFHLDTLPCVPEDEATVRSIISAGTDANLANLAIAITDKRHIQYEQIAPTWPSSNPRGFAAWFEEKNRKAAQGRIQELVAKKTYSFAEEVPQYEWKTPLQRVIQILKRHRDVMFQNNPDVAPISMIITCLAAHAYGGENDLASALQNIVERMPMYINVSRPRVPNPANPAEDYADKWAADSKLEENFRSWYTQLKVDVKTLSDALVGTKLSTDIHNMLWVELTQDEIREFDALRLTVAATAASIAPVVRVTTAPRPWGDYA